MTTFYIVYPTGSSDIACIRLYSRSWETAQEYAKVVFGDSFLLYTSKPEIPYTQTLCDWSDQARSDNRKQDLC